MKALIVFALIAGSGSAAVAEQTVYSKCQQYISRLDTEQARIAEYEINVRDSKAQSVSILKSRQGNLGRLLQRAYLETPSIREYIDVSGVANKTPKQQALVTLLLTDIQPSFAMGSALASQLQGVAKRLQNSGVLISVDEMSSNLLVRETISVGKLKMELSASSELRVVRGRVYAIISSNAKPIDSPLYSSSSSGTQIFDLERRVELASLDGIPGRAGEVALTLAEPFSKWEANIKQYEQANVEPEGLRLCRAILN